MFADICYRKNFLKNVIARVDFVPIEGLDAQLSPDVSKGVMKYFPIAEPRKATARELRISPERLSQKKSEFMEWRFFGKDRNKTIRFIPPAIIVDYSLYTTFELLMAEFLDILAVFFRVYDTAVCTRVGLRYINNITLADGSPLDWNDYINPKMLSILDIYPDKQFIARAFHNLELNFGDFNVRYQFGMHNPDYPAPIRKKSFILDLDAYYQGPQDYNEIAPSLNKFHDRIQEIFELSVTDRLREVMNA